MKLFHTFEQNAELIKLKYRTMLELIRVYISNLELRTVYTRVKYLVIE